MSASGLALLALGVSACGTERTFADGPIQTTGGAGGTDQTPGAAATTEACLAPPCASNPEQVQPVGGVSGAVDESQRGLAGANVNAADAGRTECADGATESCGPPAQEGICLFGTRTCVDGTWSECTGAVLPAARDCTSAEDNDCDGQPDNTLDDVCRCPAMGTQPCDEHPGFDGTGSCRAGVATCVIGADNTTSDWGECTGAVAPQAADSCEVQSDDANCDGTPNGGCNCVEGTAIACGPDTDDGICVRGTSTCTNGAFTPCAGAVIAARRDCSSPDDNDCDGLPDNTPDASCACAIGDIQACGAHPGRDGNGPCRAGQQTCQAGAQGATSAFGACIGSVGPALRDSCTTLGDDADCNGLPNTGCQCVAGQGNAPCSGDPRNPRCSAQGQCAPCQVNADCSLVGGGQNLCVAGVCTAPRCGDGIVQADRGEQCDDGNTRNGDGCSSGCVAGRAPEGATAFASSHLCVVLPSSLGACWGLNDDGQLGNGSTNTIFNRPALVGGLSNLVDIAVGPTNTCAATSDGSVFCWGSFFGDSPTLIDGVTDAVQLAATQNTGTSGSGETSDLPFCARRTNGRVSCWGEDRIAQEIDLEPVASLSMGNGHVCGLTSDGGLLCWGSNTTGELGLGLNSNPIDSPTRSTVFSNVAEVVTGNTYTCVRETTGAVRCVGDGMFSDNVLDVVPFEIPVVGTVKLAGGEAHACALSTSGAVQCWGGSLQQGGSGGAAPRTIALPRPAIDIGAGSFAACALLDDASIHCWGAILNTGAAASTLSTTAVEITDLDFLF